jgi:hypothetical protein
MLLRSAPFVVLALLGACRSTAEPPPPDRTTRLEQELATLTRFLQAREVADTERSLHLAVRSDVESPAMTELLGRLALLTERLDVLMQREPGTATATPRDATSHAPTTAAPAPDHDANALQMLRQALSVLEQSRNLLLENLAHVHTPAWKRSQLHITTKTTASGLQLPIAGKVVRVFTTGTLAITDRYLDLAIDGDGFFAVTLPDGATGYTRDGGLQVNADGNGTWVGGNRPVFDIVATERHEAAHGVFGYDPYFGQNQNIDYHGYHGVPTAYSASSTCAHWKRNPHCSGICDILCW